KGDMLHDTNAAPNFTREQHNHVAYALVQAGLYPNNNGGWINARKVALNSNGFSDYPEADDIELALYFYGFLVEEVQHLRNSSAVNYAYYDISTSTYMPDYRVADPASPFFKNCFGTPYEITSTDIRNFMAYSKNESEELF